MFVDVCTIASYVYRIYSTVVSTLLGYFCTFVQFLKSQCVRISTDNKNNTINYSAYFFSEQFEISVKQKTFGGKRQDAD